jgi:hypothetical protein
MARKLAAKRSAAVALVIVLSPSTLSHMIGLSYD